MTSFKKNSVTVSFCRGGVYELYKISYMWYTFVAVFVTVAVGLLVSCITGRT